MKRFLLALMGLGLFAVAPATAQEPAASPSPEAKQEDDTVKREEVVVVTASKVETTLINAPVTMSVVTSEQILCQGDWWSAASSCRSSPPGNRPK